MSVNTKVNGQLVKSAGLYKASVPIQSGDIYSFEERQIGVWTDGKPLYQKSIKLDDVTVPQSGRVLIGLSTYISNIDNIIGGEVIVIDGSTNLVLPSFQIATISQYGLTYTINKADGIVISRGSDSGTVTRDFIATVRYTKTTDVAGSGIYVPSGDKAEHYSTNEEVIGTWLGETLYRKVYQYTGSSIACAINTWTKIPFITDVNTLKDGKIYDSNGTLFLGMWGKVDGEVAFYNLRNTAITIDSGSEVMVEYTKTS